MPTYCVYWSCPEGIAAQLRTALDSVEEAHRVGVLGLRAGPGALPPKWPVEVIRTEAADAASIEVDDDALMADPGEGVLYVIDRDGRIVVDNRREG